MVANNLQADEEIILIPSAWDGCDGLAGDIEWIGEGEEGEGGDFLSIDFPGPIGPHGEGRQRQS